VTASTLLQGLASRLETNRQGLSEWGREEVDLASHALKTLVAAGNGKEFLAFALRCVCRTEKSSLAASPFARRRSPAWSTGVRR
jgi:hypothetical protein